MSGIAYLRRVAEREEEFITASLGPHCGRVLEVGAGAGRLTRHLAGLADALTVCDADESRLHTVREQLGSADGVEYHHVDIAALHELPFYGDYDAAVALRVIPLTSDWEASLWNLCDTVRPGGKLFFDLWRRRSFDGWLAAHIMRPHPKHHLLTSQEIYAAVEHLPVQVIKTHRWGYPRLGGLHGDWFFSRLFPHGAYSTLYYCRRDVEID